MRLGKQCSERSLDRARIFTEPPELHPLVSNPGTEQLSNTQLGEYAGMLISLPADPVETGEALETSAAIIRHKCF